MDKQIRDEKIREFRETFRQSQGFAEMEFHSNLGVTVFSVREPGDAFKTVSVAYCGANDTFDKSIGRMTAFNNMWADQGFRIRVPQRVSLETLTWVLGA